MFSVAILALVYVLNVATACEHLPPKSVFKQLSAEELSVLELAQNPKLLEISARPGEHVIVNINESSQGAVVQDGVNVVLNCLPWLNKFPGGLVRWYFCQYLGIDNIELLPPKRIYQGITGNCGEVYNIPRTMILESAQDPSRGIYKCEVCRGSICNSANTTLIIAGRAPLLNSTTGRSKSQAWIHYGHTHNVLPFPPYLLI